MKRQKIVLKHCPHFYKILDFEIYEDDVISSKLISLYKDYIFSIDVTDERALKKAEKIDLIISKKILPIIPNIPAFLVVSYLSIRISPLK